FSLLDEWEDRYRYVIELGEGLPPFPDEGRNPANKVAGCVSQVWLITEYGPGADPVVTFQGDSDAHIVRGLVAIMLALFSGRPASAIQETDAE
ncbi:SufE family protein, partial [Mesorhizobium sp. M2E.F.Ca.ET.154.01.1.1]